MSFFGWLTGWATRQSKGKQETVPAASAHDDVPAVGIDAALQVSTVWACVKLLSETISSLPLVLYQSDSEGRRDTARSDPLYRVLHDMPNRRHTAQEFWEFMLLNRFLRGNAYARIQRGANGSVVALWPLAADQMRVEVLEDGSLVYVYRIDSTELIYLEEDILHIKGMGNGIVGLSPLDYMRASVSLAVKSQNHLNKTLSQGARRPGVLMSEHVLTEAQRKALRKNFQDIVEGKQKELYILEANMKFEPLGMTPADVQLLETRKYAVEDLARWFGVPSVLINDTEKTTTWGTGVGQIIEGFYKFTIRPEVERIEQSLHRWVLTGSQRAAGMSVEFNLDALLRASLKERMEIYAQATQNGVFSRNECRKFENLPPVDGGQELTAQVNLAPLDMLRNLENRGASNASQETIAQ